MTVTAAPDKAMLNASHRPPSAARALALAMLVYWGSGVSGLWADVTQPSTAAVQAAKLPDFTGLVREAGQGVVNISTRQRFSAPDDDGEAPFDELFRRFFGDEGAPGPDFDDSSLGSGFILSSDGLIVTNLHVIEDADEIVVGLSDRRQLVAEVVGSDPTSDIALLRVDAEKLPAVALGDSDRLEVGSWVLAIGSPFGFERSATAGIVSAKGRSLPNERNQTYVPFLQTDVAINPGNSGGPLFNLAGEVVGINSQIYSRTGGFMGLSFAIPISFAVDVIDQLLEAGQVSRGWLGVMITEVGRERASQAGLERAIGALVADVVPDSPAAQAGLRTDDIIVTFDGRAVPNSSALPALVGRVRPGNDATVGVVRSGSRLDLSVTIGRLQDDQAGVSPAPADDLPESMPPQAPEVVALEPLGVDVGVVKTPRGTAIWVTEVREGPARTAGVRRGDRLLAFNGRAIDDLASLRAHVEGLSAAEEAGSDEDVAISTLRVERDGEPLVLALRPSRG